MKESLARRLYKEFNKVIFDDAMDADLPIIWDSKLRSTAGLVFVLENRIIFFYLTFIIVYFRKWKVPPAFFNVFEYVIGMCTSACAFLSVFECFECIKVYLWVYLSASKALRCIFEDIWVHQGLVVWHPWLPWVHSVHLHYNSGANFTILLLTIQLVHLRGHSYRV